MEKHPEIRDLVETLSFREFVLNKVASLQERNISLEEIWDMLTDEEFDEFMLILKEP